MASEKFLLDTATELPEYMFRLAATILNENDRNLRNKKRYESYRASKQVRRYLTWR